MCLNRGQAIFTIDTKYASDAYLIYSWLLKSGWKYLKIYSKNNTEIKRITKSEFYSPGFELGNYLTPFTVKIVVNRDKFEKFRNDILRMSQETGLLNIYRDYDKKCDGIYLNHWKLILK